MCITALIETVVSKESLIKHHKFIAKLTNGEN